MRQRLQKILAAAGIASRRKSEELISAGRVSVNGVIATLGESADPSTDEITLDGAPLSAEKKRFLALNKPAGYVTTLSDPQGRPTVMDLIDVPERVYPVGRLDAETEGLLIFTNEGMLSHRIAHPKYEIEKVYVADVSEPISKAGVESLERGVELDDGLTLPAVVNVLSSDRKQVEVTIHEGRNRIVRRMLEAIGSPVRRLERIRLGEVTLEGLQRGTWRNLEGREVDRLRQTAAAAAKRKRPGRR